MQHYTIFARLPGLNDYTRANRGNRYAGAKWKKETEELVSMFLVNPKPAETPVVIRIQWQEKTARRDLDNIAFAKKFILDAMVKKGILPDDGPKYVIGFSDTFRKGDTDRVDIFIEEGINDARRRDSAVHQGLRVDQPDGSLPGSRDHEAGNTDLGAEEGRV